MSEYFTVAPDTLAAVVALVQEQYLDTLPHAIELDVTDILTGIDWPEGAEHQAWLDTAPVAEIAGWVASVYADLIDGRRAEREFECTDKPD